MHDLLELYEMVAMNDGKLTLAERASLLKAKLAMQMFVRAMTAFNGEPQKQMRAAA